MLPPPKIFTIPPETPCIYKYTQFVCVCVCVCARARTCLYVFIGNILLKID